MANNAFGMIQGDDGRMFFWFGEWDSQVMYRSANAHPIANGESYMILADWKEDTHVIVWQGLVSNDAVDKVARGWCVDCKTPKITGVGEEVGNG